MHDICSPHARAAYAEWAAMQTTIDRKEARPLNGNDLSIADVVAVSW